MVNVLNIQEMSNKAKSIIEYIKQLHYADGTLVIHSEKQTGFVGMITSLQNVIEIYTSYYEKFDGYLLTYKLSQDHLESFFSAVRSKGGHSNNPTCYQFINRFKRLLVHANVQGSDNSNCLSLDDTEVIQIPTEFWEQYATCEEKIIYIIENVEEDQLQYLENDQKYYGDGLNKMYIDDVVEYIAGFVVRSLLRRMRRCSVCFVFLTDEKCLENNTKTMSSSLLQRKDRGGLIQPCQDVIYICRIIEKNFRECYHPRKGIFRDLYCTIVSQVPKCLLDLRHGENPKKHRAELLRFIVMKYLQLRIRRVLKNKKKTQKNVRRIYTKMILNLNQ